MIGYQFRSLGYAVNLQKKLQADMDKPPDEAYPPELRTETLYRGAVSDAERKLLIRFYLEGWSQKELADAMGISDNACKLRIKRAQARLRNALEEDKPAWTGSAAELLVLLGGNMKANAPGTAFALPAFISFT